MSVEIVAMGITQLNGGMEPGTVAMRYCNPGLLHNFGSGSLRTFTSFQVGFRALVAELGKIDPELTLAVAFKKFGTLSESNGIERQFALYDYFSRAFDTEINQDTIYRSLF